MKVRNAILLALSLLAPLLAATPAHAEKLLFDHRLNPALNAVLDNGRQDMTFFDGSNPRYMVDRIAVQGRSARDWVEALEVIVRVPDKTVRSAADWLQQIRERTSAACAAEFTPLAQDESSLTFMRRTRACDGSPAETGLYRIVTGSKSLFLLAARYKGAMDEPMRQRWLALLASARLEN